MIKVRFEPPVGDAEWDKWIKDAKRETKELTLKVKTKVKYGFKSSLYKRTRQTIFDAFSGKCAYCEAKFILTETGDVEHYRPKGRITDEHGQRVMLGTKGKSLRPHPGYYWLAYSWQNLLPSCSKCNRPSKTRGGRLVGKGTCFPVLKRSLLKATHARRPNELKNENPAFIQPMWENPDTHLRFDETSGHLIAKTRRGRLCIDILDLNREGLSEERRDIYLSVASILVAAHMDAATRNWSAFLAKLKIINSYKEGKKPYSWVGRLALRHNSTLVKRLDLFSHLPQR